VRTPEGVEVVVARTIKPDGRIGEPEEPPPPVPGPPQRLAIGLLPESYSASWAPLPVRRHPLFVAIRQKLDLTLALPSSAELAHAPEGAKVVSPFGVHDTKIAAERTDDGREQLRVHKSLTVPLAIIPAADYATFVAACRRFDRADRLDLEVRWRR